MMISFLLAAEEREGRVIKRIAAISGLIFIAFFIARNMPLNTRDVLNLWVFFCPQRMTDVSIFELAKP